MSSITAIQSAICETIAEHNFNYAHEAQLQEGLALALTGAGFGVYREVRLGDRDRIDLLIGRVGIEVKVAGQATRVLEQLARYAEHDRIGALILVTNRFRHDPPGMLNGKPVEVVTLLVGGL